MLKKEQKGGSKTDLRGSNKPPMTPPNAQQRVAMKVAAAPQFSVNDIKSMTPV